MNDNLQTLKELTEALLFDANNYQRRTESIRAMHELYSSFTGISAGNIDDDDIMLPTGKAISPIQAAHCMVEQKRTVTFLCGIYKALLQLRKEKPGQKLNIFYAGCGPYATLVTPFTSLFTSDELAFYMLDISEVCLGSVKRIYSSLGLADYIKGYICEDAATCRLPDDTIHMVISETMQRALAKEPQVSIMLNLIPQMDEKAIFIPEEITIAAKLLNWTEEETGIMQEGYQPKRIDLGELYTIGRHNCKEHTPVTIQIPEAVGIFKYLYLFTEITVYADEKLRANNSDLTLPLKLVKVDERQGGKIEFRYEISSIPGFKYRWI